MVSLSAGILISACGPANENAAGARGDGRFSVATLQRGNGGEPDTLDPHLVEESAAGQIVRDLYEGLTTEGPDASIRPGVAESWETDAGGLRYTFVLRENARWSNGDPLVAGDFVAGFRRSLDPATAAPLAGKLLSIRHAAEVLSGTLAPDTLGVTALDDRTLQIELAAPAPYFLAILSNPVAFPIHRPTLLAHGTRFARAGTKVSNGPYRLAEWAVQSHVRLERNRYYHSAEEVAWPVVMYHVTEDMTSEFNRFRAGELDITFQVPAGQIEWSRRNLSGRLRTDPYLSTYFLLVNLTASAVGSREVRKALSLGVDRDLIAERVLGGGELPAYGFVPPGMPNYSGARYPWADWSMEQRVEEARRLLRRAGYDAGNRLSVELHYNTGENHRRIAVAIASMWRDWLDVDVELNHMEWKALMQLRGDAAGWQLLRYGWVADYLDAFAFLELMKSDHAQNTTGWRSVEYDSLLRDANSVSDAGERARILMEAEGVLLDDYPVIPVHFSVSRRLVSERVGGYMPNPLNRIQSRWLYPTAASESSAP